MGNYIDHFSRNNHKSQFNIPYMPGMAT